MNSQSILPASCTSSCLMLMIWSSRARNRSADPVVSCFFGRIAPSDAATESWEIDLVDALALLLQDHALLEDDVLELRGKQCEVFRGERSQKQIAPARARAIQFHPQPFSSSQPHQRTALRRRARPAGGIGKPPARALSVRYPTKMLRNEGLR